ncbi:O-antigen ligase family protein [Bacillus sp. 165]|uniref:O-antigen ligase family protein n=1 Tax=Bacillus sp. 165 TaxID=1529117 RepID=UPI001AD9F028|nr:O-antigen ligase family protein [Bacillus sp. 165]MBO9130028.1 O-antigen ligase family protein [Bacillus sp. 165]
MNKDYNFSSYRRYITFTFLSGLAISILSGLIAAKADSKFSIQLAILILILLIGFLFSYTNSKFVIPYILSIWAFAPEIRRLIDWFFGEYSSVQLLSVSPLLVTLTLLVQVNKRFSPLQGLQKKIIINFGIAISYSFVIGVIMNKFGAVYELLNYTIPYLLLVYVNTRKGNELKFRDNWLRSVSWIAIVVSVYAWIQFLLLPPWDRFWMENVQMGSIGLPNPLEVRVFSTLNSPGPAAIFLSFALILMIIERKWRTVLGWTGVIIVVSALMLTLVRSSWLFTIIGIVLYAVLNRNKTGFKLMIRLVLFSIVIFIVTPLLPSAESVTQRFETFQNISEDHSFQARINFSKYALNKVLTNPIGSGLGSTGQGTKLNNDGNLGEYGNFDNGFLNIIFTFGWLGTLFIVRALYYLLVYIKEVSTKFDGDIFVRVTFSVTICMIVSLSFVNNFAGLGGLLFSVVLSTVFINKKHLHPE